VKRNAAFGVGALLGAAAAIVWDRRSRLRDAPAPEARQRELRAKLAEAQQTETPARAAEAPSPTVEPPKPPEPAPPAPPPPAQPPATEPKERPAPPPGPPPADEFEAMRRRIHQEGKAAAEEMRRAPDEGS
jgi:outer membrane biosynthesis protein TonB